MKLTKPAILTNKILQTVHENKALIHMCVSDWFKELTEGHNDHENDPKSGQNHQLLQIHKQLQQFFELVATDHQVTLN